MQPVCSAAAAAAARTGTAHRAPGRGRAAAEPDPLLVQKLIEARTRVADYLDPDHGLSLSAIARRAGVHVGDVSHELQLAFLAPDLVAAILDGTQPVALTPERSSIR